MTAFCCIYLFAMVLSRTREEEHDYECGKSKSKAGGGLAE